MIRQLVKLDKVTAHMSLPTEKQVAIGLSALWVQRGPKDQSQQCISQFLNIFLHQSVHVTLMLIPTERSKYMDLF